MAPHTLQSCDTHGWRYAAKWLSQTVPAEIQAAVATAFRSGERTVTLRWGVVAMSAGGGWLSNPGNQGIAVHAEATGTGSNDGSAANRL